MVSVQHRGCTSMLPKEHAAFEPPTHILLTEHAALGPPDHHNCPLQHTTQQGARRRLKRRLEPPFVRAASELRTVPVCPEGNQVTSPRAPQLKHTVYACCPQGQRPNLSNYTHPRQTVYSCYPDSWSPTLRSPSHCGSPVMTEYSSPPTITAGMANRNTMKIFTIVLDSMSCCTLQDAARQLPQSTIGC